MTDITNPKITKNVRGNKTTYYIDYEDGKMFRIQHRARFTWQVEEWNFTNGCYDYCGEQQTAAEAINSVIIENGVVSCNG